MRAVVLAFAILASAPALATDHTDDTDVMDTDSGAVAGTDGMTASERAGDDGGLACSSVGGSALGLTLPLLGLALVVTRRRG